MGQRRVTKTKTWTGRFSEEELRKLDELAVELEMTAVDVVRTLIADRHRHQRISAKVASARDAFEADIKERLVVAEQAVSAVDRWIAQGGEDLQAPAMEALDLAVARMK